MSVTTAGLVRITAYVRKDQYLWLHALALTQALDAERGRPDASAILRGMIDVYQREHSAGGRTKGRA